MLAKKFVLLSIVAVCPPFGKLAMVAVPPRVVGKGHDGAPMERAEPIIELLADWQFGNDLVLRNVNDIHADQSGKWRLLFRLRIHVRSHSHTLGHAAPVAGVCGLIAGRVHDAYVGTSSNEALPLLERSHTRFIALYYGTKSIVYADGGGEDCNYGNASGNILRISRKWATPRFTSEQQRGPSLARRLAKGCQ